jgi:hypothetical protein
MAVQTGDLDAFAKSEACLGYDKFVSRAGNNGSQILNLTATGFSIAEAS